MPKNMRNFGAGRCRATTNVLNKLPSQCVCVGLGFDSPLALFMPHFALTSASTSPFHYLRFPLAIFLSLSYSLAWRTAVHKSNFNLLYKKKYREKRKNNLCHFKKAHTHTHAKGKEKIRIGTQTTTSAAAAVQKQRAHTHRDIRSKHYLPYNARARKREHYHTHAYIYVNVCVYICICIKFQQFALRFYLRLFSLRYSRIDQHCIWATEQTKKEETNT